MWKGKHIVHICMLVTVNLMLCINLVQVVCTDCCTQEAYVPYMKKTSIVCDSCYEQLSKLTVYQCTSLSVQLCMISRIIQGVRY